MVSIFRGYMVTQRVQYSYCNMIASTWGKDSYHGTGHEYPEHTVAHLLTTIAKTGWLLYSKISFWSVFVPTPWGYIEQCTCMWNFNFTNILIAPDLSGCVIIWLLWAGEFVGTIFNTQMPKWISLWQTSRTQYQNMSQTSSIQEHIRRTRLVKQLAEKTIVNTLVLYVVCSI